ncbi:Multicopper oxidase [Seminavis robusta]|uniref:Multicopper oxidase n=1 Tax=Seminavis robusta TaxID=568900 RepID=A0A9N8EE33_9STRA|nr:Multicopper oxidase [Seminavis robusta]|eukprot:Sro989_g228480.1 Multicopper oxidase (624) ;mRNA; f:16736-18861
MMTIAKLFAAASFLLTCPVRAEVNFQPPVLESEDGVLDVVLDIGFATTLNGTRFSPQYNGGPVGPTLRVIPGDTLRVTLNNNLPPSPPGDIELLNYVKNPQNEIDSYVNVTKIYNRLSSIGNVYNPEYGFWGFNLASLHFHGAGFSPSIEDLRNPIDGGESKSFEFKIPEDHPPGLVWYHSHNHGLGEYEMMSGLFGAMIIEGTANDVTAIPEIESATEVVMILNEVLVDEKTGIPPPFFPIVMAFDWKSVVNGRLAEETKYEFQQGTTVLFRTISAGVEATIGLYFVETNAPDFVLVAEDGFIVPTIESKSDVSIPAGARKEFLVRFDQPGTFHLRRHPWTVHGLRGVEACNASFGIESDTCVSYDVDKPIATITVLEADPPVESSLPTELPEYHQVYKDMEMMPVVKKRTITMQQAIGFPIFQIPYEGPFVPPGVGFGINGRLVTPHFRHGEIQSSTCEEWTVISDPPAAEHAFHIHTNPFLVTAEDGVPAEKPFWRDTYAIYGANMTIKTCFNHLKRGDYVLVHCHQMAHLGIGMGAYYSVVGGGNDVTMDDLDSLDYLVDGLTPGNTTEEVVVERSDTNETVEKESDESAASQISLSIFAFIMVVMSCTLASQFLALLA